MTVTAPETRDEIVEKAARAMAHALLGIDLWGVIDETRPYGIGPLSIFRKEDFRVMAHAAIAVALEADGRKMSLSHPTVTPSVTVMLTEAEARDKYCPLTSTTDNDARCIASQCMAWRVGIAAKPKHPGEAIHMANGVVGIIPGTERPAEPEKGFCGQFGRPQYQFEDPR